MAVALGTATVIALNNASLSTTQSITSTSGPLYVRVNYWNTGGSISGITFNGSSTGWAKVAGGTGSSGTDRAEIWRVLSPSAVTANLVITQSGGNASGSAAWANTTGQDTGTPEGTAAAAQSASAGTTTGNLAVSAVTGDLIIVSVVNGNGSAITPGATGATPTEDFDSPSNGEGSEGFKVDGAATAVSATFTSTTWAIAAIPLKASAGAAATPFPPFRRRVVRLPGAV